MPLIARIPATHSIRELRSAAALRYNEGRRLVLAGDRLAGLYLWGYAAEMLLKSAYFRLLLLGPLTPITMGHLHTAKAHAHAMGLTFSNLHDLVGWGALLVEEHRLRGNPYAPAFARSLTAHVRRIYQNWREHLRYRTNRPYRGEVAQTHQALAWLFGQYRYL